MANLHIATKRVAISKANAQMVAIVAVASFITVFSLIASQAVFSANKYRAKVVTEKEKAHKQLIVNTKAFDSLVVSYKDFNTKNTNVIGGDRGGAGDRDGNNAKIILDALPSSYDFPAVTSSLEKILTERKFKISSITGVDDQVSQGSKDTSPSPAPVTMPFTFNVTSANYTSVQDLIDVLQRSIRPIQIDKINMSGSSDDMSLTVDGHTFYQPGKSLTITTKAVK